MSTFFVKLIVAQNDQDNIHIDGYFCTTTTWHLKELASMLEPNKVCFLSQNDKACVTTGMTAAKKQSPLLIT